MSYAVSTITSTLTELGRLSGFYDFNSDGTDFDSGEGCGLASATAEGRGAGGGGLLRRTKVPVDLSRVYSFD